MTIYQYQRDCESEPWDHCFGIITEEQVTEWSRHCERVISNPTVLNTKTTIGTF